MPQGAASHHLPLVLVGHQTLCYWRQSIDKIPLQDQGGEELVLKSVVA